MKRLLLVLLVLSQSLHAQPQTLLDIQQKWAQINYELADKEKLPAFKQLIQDCENLVAEQPDSPEPLIWLGITQSTAAGVKGGLGALSMVKKAKKNFERALKLDSSALDGSAVTSLGILYHEVPGWPIAFGDDDKARSLLSRGVELNPDGIDSNYFMANFLYDEKDYYGAHSFAVKAMNAPQRPNRLLADKGRHLEIAQLLEQIEAKL